MDAGTIAVHERRRRGRREPPWPDTEYASHVHSQPCDEDKGGPHFKFDREGSDMPPNEIHLGFTSNAQGEGEQMAKNERTAPPEARSIVVHLATETGHPPRIACADLR